MEDQKWIENEEKYQAKINSIDVRYEPCTTVTVTVMRGRNISVGWLHDWIDTPDAKVYVTCNTAVGEKKFKTKIARNSRNPEWNESFTFVFPENTKNASVKVDVYEEDRFKYDPHLGQECYEIHDLKDDEPKIYTLDMKRHGQVDLQFIKRHRTSPDFRMSLGLSEEERKYRVKRKKKTMEAIRRLLGEDAGPKTMKETPTIALAVSGGGYRAMVASCGAMEALIENNIIDTMMYFAGLSGSSWYLSTSYYHKVLGDVNQLRSHHDWIRTQMQEHLTLKSFDTSFLRRFLQYRSHKVEHSQKTTFVDFFGLSLGETFLDSGDPSATLSSLKGYVDSGDVPFPIISCAHVRDNLPMSAFWDEVEMTPVEVSFPSYGINIPAAKFNSVWGKGILQHDLPEPPLHYLMGTSGSAFAIMFDKIDDQIETEAMLQKYIENTNQTNLEEDVTTERINSDDSDSVDSSDDEDEVDGCPTLRNSSQRKVTNFASNKDSWLDRIKRRVSHKNDDEPDGDTESTFGRSFLIERTAKVNNCATGFQRLQKYLFSTEAIENKKLVNGRIRNTMSTKKRNIALCDSGIGCNLPTVHVMRPQRTVDILIVVDCSLILDKDSLNMECFATVQKQISDHGIKFPNISIEKIAEDPFREVYLFEDPNDPECPTVLWFTLANGAFRQLENPPRRPGYPTPDPVDGGEVDFNDFYVSPDSPEFSTLNFSFSALSFDRLRELMKYNIDSNIQLVKEKIGDKIKQLRERT